MPIVSTSPPLKRRANFFYKMNRSPCRLIGVRRGSLKRLRNERASPMLTFEQCEKMTKRKGQKKIGCNTLLWRVSEDTFSVRYHWTEIVKIHRDGRWMVNNGGWYSPTTKKRLNQYSPARVFQKNHSWYFQIGDKAVPYENYVSFNADGQLAG